MNPVQKVKGILIGGNKTGKTSLFSSFSNKSFTQSYEPTLGMALNVKTLEKSGQTFSYQLWDTAGLQKYRSLIKTNYKGTQIYFIVYDITNKESFDLVPSYLSEINEITKGESKIIFLLGNKADLESERVISTTDGETYAKENGIQFFELTAKEDGSFEKIVLKGLSQIGGDAASLH